MVYPIAKLTIIPIYRLWLRKVVGLENIPEDGPFILAANHSSYYDSMLLHSILVPKLNRKIHTLVNSIYWNNPFNRYFLNLAESIPVYTKKNAGKNKKNNQSMNKAIKYLKNKRIVQIFPEGTRSKDGNLKKAYTGVAILALKTKAPIVPVGIISSNKILPKGKTFPRFKRCEVKIGKPLYFKGYYDKKENEKIIKNTTKKVMKEIAKLIGQKYKY